MSAEDSDRGFEAGSEQLAVYLSERLALDVQVHVVVEGMLVGEGLRAEVTYEGFKLHMAGFYMFFEVVGSAEDLAASWIWTERGFH